LLAPAATGAGLRLLSEDASPPNFPARLGLHLIARRYCGSSLVITSRLHGAIISYALGIPYVAVDRDTKITEFARIYGNGVAVTIDEIGPYLEPGRVQTDAPIQFEDILVFAARVRGWLQAHNASMCPTSRLIEAIPARTCQMQARPESRRG
jgi:hypothetical protein